MQGGTQISFIDSLVDSEMILAYIPYVSIAVLSH